MTAPSLYLHFRALGRPFLWAAYFSPPTFTLERMSAKSFALVLFLLARHRRTSRVLHFERERPER